MKKFITGIIFTILGSISSIILISIAALNPVVVNGRHGLFASLQGNDIFFSFVCFLLFGVSGAIICLYESYIKKQ